MRLNVRARLVASALVIVTPNVAAAGPPATPGPPPTPQAQPTPEPTEGPDTAAEPTRDIFDVLRQLRHKPPPAEPADAHEMLMIAAAPVVSYNPASGAGIGAAGNLAFYEGFPQTTSISSVVASLIATSKKQVLFNAKADVSARNNRWVLRGDDRLYWTSQDTYGLGTSTTPDDEVNARYDFFRVYETLYRRVHRRLYLGAAVLYNIHADVRPAEGAESAWPDSPYAVSWAARRPGSSSTPTCERTSG
jgi:hypothetical protein